MRISALFLATAFLGSACSKGAVKMTTDGKPSATGTDLKLGTGAGTSQEIFLGAVTARQPVHGLLYGLKIGDGDTEGITPQPLVDSLKLGLWRYGANWFFGRTEATRQKILQGTSSSF